MVGISVFELGNVAATLLILRATDISPRAAAPTTLRRSRSRSMSSTTSRRRSPASRPAGRFGGGCEGGVGCVETAEHAAVATLAADSVRGSAFGVLAAVQSLGNPHCVGR